MNRLSGFAFALCLLLALPAAAAPVDATFQKDCSPSDQLALRLTLPAREEDVLRLRLWGQAYEGLGNGQMLIISDGSQRQGQVTSDMFVCTRFGCTPGSAQLRIGQYRANDFLDGELIWHDGGTPQSIPFVARFVDEPTPCE